jgi:hypothetical protein
MEWRDGLALRKDSHKKHMPHAKAIRLLMVNPLVNGEGAI